MFNSRRVVIFILITLIAGSIGYPEESDTPKSKSRLMGVFNCLGPVRSTAVISDGIVYVGSDGKFLIAIDRKKVKLKWSFKADASVASSPALDDTRVYFASKKGTVYAVNREDGQEMWHFNTKAIGYYGRGWDYFLSSPLVVADLVIVGSGDNHIYAFNRETGAMAWKFDTGTVVRSSPAVDSKNSVIFCGTMKGELFALFVKTGRVKWKFRTAGNKYFPDGELLFKPLVYRGMVYVGSRDASFYAIDANSGKLKWKTTDSRGAWYTTAAVGNDTVYAANSDGHYVQALDPATGKEKWKYHADDLIFSTPLVHQGMLYFGSHDGHVYAVDAETGKMQWRYNCGDDVLGSGMVDGNMLMIGCDDGRLYGLNTNKVPMAPAGSHRAVYWDPQLDARLTGVSIHDKEKIYKYFRGVGYDVLDGPGLVTFFKDRVSDKQASTSVVVLASVVFPFDIYLPQSGAQALLRQYLDAGGNILSLGNPPFMYTVKESGGKVIVPANELASALGLDRNLFIQVYYYYDAYISFPTVNGKQLGLPDWWSSGYGVDRNKVSVVLGRDEFGRATAWVKSYSSEPGRGLIRLWGKDQLPEDLAFVKAIADGVTVKKD